MSAASEEPRTVCAQRRASRPQRGNPTDILQNTAEYPDRVASLLSFRAFRIHRHATRRFLNPATVSISSRYRRAASLLRLTRSKRSSTRQLAVHSITSAVASRLFMHAPCTVLRSLELNHLTIDSASLRAGRDTNVTPTSANAKGHSSSYSANCMLRTAEGNLHSRWRPDTVGELRVTARIEVGKLVPDE
jgi:hypothetical protein